MPGSVIGAATIVPATLNVGAVAQNKVYDGSSQALVSLTDDRVAGDMLGLTWDKARFDTVLVGVNKPVVVSGIRIASGIDAGNYVLASTTATGHADILDKSEIRAQQPLLPQPVLPAAESIIPAPLLDLSLPATFGSGALAALSADTGSAATPPAATTPRARLTVTLTKSADSLQDGLVTVAVPREMIAAGESFSFDLPAEVSESDGVPLKLSLIDGRPLPAWLRFNPKTRTFAVSRVMARDLPLQIRVSNGSRQWTVVVMERKGR